MLDVKFIIFFAIYRKQIFDVIPRRCRLDAAFPAIFEQDNTKIAMSEVIMETNTDDIHFLDIYSLDIIGIIIKRNMMI